LGANSSDEPIQISVNGPKEKEHVNTSFRKSGETEPALHSSDTKRSLILWNALTYFLCLPAGDVTTLAYFIGKPFSKDASLFHRIMKYLCMVGSLIGAVIYLYAVTHYSHCDEAMYFSIVGLITKIFMG